MENIIEFKKDYFETTKEISEILYNSVLNSKNKRIQAGYAEDEILEYLETYIINIVSRLEKRNWLAREKQQKFIDYYKRIDEEDIDEIFYKLEYIYLVDLDSSLLNEDEEYIKLIIKNLDVYFEEDISITNIKFIKELLDKLESKQIRKIFKNFDREDNYKMNDVIELLIRGYDPLTTYMTMTEIDNIVEETLDEGILTIDRVYKYYYEQSLILTGIKDEEQEDYEIVDKVNKILLIKSFDEKSKTTYLAIINEINKLNINLIKNIELVVALTEIFIYYKDRINEMSIDTIKSIACYAAINELEEADYDTLDDIIEKKR